MDSKQKKFSKQQTSAAMAVINHYLGMVIRSVILLAQMQSGKSDTYWFVAFEMLRHKKIKNVVVVAGFQDTELVEQLKDFTPSMKLYRRYMEEVLHLSVDERIDIEDMIPGCIKVVYGTELTEPQFQNATDTLFIWDESHHAQAKINRPYKFMKALNVSVDGDSDKLGSGGINNFVLSVSATPYSEISDAIHEDQEKVVEKMEPGDGYMSVKKFYSEKKIIAIKEWEKTLPTCFQEQKKITTPKYSIVRVRGEDMDKAVKIATSAGVEFEIYDGEQKAITKKTRNQTKMQSFEDLKNAPARHKVIFIRGMLRMGKRIPKTHISFVMETSKNANTDVLLQGLLGRMCGYHTNVDIKIYVGENLFKKGKDGKNELERYIQMMEGDDITTMPRRGTNLKGGVHSDNDWFTALPVVISRPSPAAAELDPDYELYTKEQLVTMFTEAIVSGDATNLNGEEKTDELLIQLRGISPEDINVHQLFKSNGSINETFKDMPQLMSEALVNQAAITHIPAGCGFSSNEKTIVVIYEFNTNAFADLGFPKGTLVLQGRTKTATESERLKAVIPKTTGLEAFTSRHEDGTTVVGNGAYSIHAPINTWNVSTSMQKHIENMIRVSRIELEGETMPRCITSNQVEGSAWQGILVNTEVLLALEKNGEIFNYIQRAYGVKLKITKTRGKTPLKLVELGQTRLVKIEW
jgi:hypothetical protein